MCEAASLDNSNWGKYSGVQSSSGSSRRVRGGAEKHESMQPSLVAIFFMTYFYRARGGHGPLGPPGSATAIICQIMPTLIIYQRKLWILVQGKLLSFVICVQGIRFVLNRLFFCVLLRWRTTAYPPDLLPNNNVSLDRSIFA